LGTANLPEIVFAAQPTTIGVLFAGLCMQSETRGSCAGRQPVNVQQARLAGH
jgi:hypothetical protein